MGQKNLKKAQFLSLVLHLGCKDSSVSIQKNLREAAEFLKTAEGEAVARDAYTVAEATRDAVKILANAVVIDSMVYQRVQNVKQAKQIKALVDFIQADFYALNGARICLATGAAAPGITIPLVGKVVVLLQQ